MTLFADPPCARRYEKEFENVQDVFELQRNLNNAFAYDLVPSPSVVIAALRAARRVNDFPTAVRIFEGMFLAHCKHCDHTLEAHTNTATQASTPRSRTRANTTSTSRSCRASGKSSAWCSRRSSSPLARKRLQPRELCESGFKKTTKIDHAR